MGEAVAAGARAAPRVRADRAERLGCAVLLAGVALAWAVQYQPFQLPNNDYYSFERVARSFAQGELPASFKRMPILPACMALVAPLMPGPHPYLNAALVVNAFFALATLALLFHLARRLVGPGALWVPLLTACTLQFHAMGLQPLVEPSLGFFVVLAFVLFAARSPWRYAAAFGAALSRYDAAALIPVLFALDVWREGRWVRHGLLAALAASGLVAWAGAGSLAGSGGGFYLQLMEGMGWQPAPGFLARSLREPFRGWYVDVWWMAPAFAVVVLAPLLWGLGVGWRRFRPEAVGLAAFWVLSVSVIVAFGIDKARYVYGTQWIPILFWTTGSADLALRLGRLLPRWLPRSAGALTAAATALAAAAGLLWLHRLWRDVPEPAGPVDLAFGALALALGLAVAARLAARAAPDDPRWRAALLAGAAVVLVPLVAGGLFAKVREFFDIWHANHAAVVLTPWIERHVGPAERMVLLPRSHVLFLAPDLDASRLVLFSDLEAEDAAGLAEEMRRRGLTYATFTERASRDNPAQEFYYRAKKQRLSEVFAGGGAVPGFEHVATLPLPPSLGEEPVQVYRVQGAR